MNAIIERLPQRLTAPRIPDGFWVKPRVRVGAMTLVLRDEIDKNR